MFKYLKRVTKRLIDTRIIIATFLGVLFTVCGIFAYHRLSIAGKGKILFFVLWAVLYLLAVAVSEWIYIFRYKRERLIGDMELSSVLGNMSVDFILRLNMPVFISDDQGKIIWYNRIIGDDREKRDKVYGQNIELILSTSVAKIISAGKDGVVTTALGTRYRVFGYDVVTGDKKYYITVWDDLSEISALEDRVSEEEMVVGYAILDNLDELSTFVTDRYKEASIEVENILKNWAAEVSGIFREISKDKYIFVFARKNLEPFMQNKFEILDRIREITVGEERLPVTVSMGISNVQGTFAEKERVANESLDLALQRGGDQVVVKSDNCTEFYGGKSKTVQKRTKVRARVVAGELISLMENSSNVLIMGHRGADFDSLGACVGIARLALYHGVEVNIIVNKQDANVARALRAFEDLAEYKNVFVDAMTAQDKIGSETLLIIADVNNPSQFEAPDVAKSVHKTVIIDHHRKTLETEENPKITYIEPSASSASELVSEILEQSLPGASLAKQEADMLFTGILLDTKQFSKNTGTRTFSAALYLRSEGANPNDAQEMFRTNIDDLVSEAKFESNVVIYRKIFAISVYEGECESSGRISAAKAADKLLTVEGVAASFALCKIDDTVHISARSQGKVNVQLILEKIGGGGHFDAAATQVKDSSLTDALNSLKGAIDEYFDETM